MCGIAGFCNIKENYNKDRGKWNAVLKSMNQVQKHRGPDDEGTSLDPNCGLAHVRLSILDLETGHQPMIRKCASNSCSILLNGEIYNMPELKKELLEEGVVFETESDTEVVLTGYMKYGADYVKRLNGIFAIAIWDTRISKLFLFRDRLGVKPLFYTIIDGTIV